MGLEFAPDGTLYAVGDANPASPTFNSLVYGDVTDRRVHASRIDWGSGGEFLMDFAFDKNGTMYGASSHMLFTIDRKTGTATKVADFVGGGDIMGLSYDAKKNRLYATDWKAPNSALYLVDVQTGFLDACCCRWLPDVSRSRADQLMRGPCRACTLTSAAA